MVLKRNRRLIVVIIVLSVFLAIAFGVIYLNLENFAENNTSGHSTALVDSKPKQETFSERINENYTFAVEPSAPVPVLIANGEIVKWTALEKLAPFTVETSGAKSYYVFLKCLSVSGSGFHLPSTGDMSFYVAAGQKAEVLVPLGEYEIYYATGDTWYGPEIKFGSGTQYFRCEETFSFIETLSGYSGWTVMLYPVYNGNLETEKVSAAEFPE